MLWDSLNKALEEVIEPYRAIGTTFQQLKNRLVIIPEEEMTEKASQARISMKCSFFCKIFCNILLIYGIK